MKPRTWNLVYALLSLAVGIVMVVWRRPTIDLSEDSGSWLPALLLVIVGAFIMEPRFTGGGAATSNLIAVILIAVSLDDPSLSTWWRSLLVVSGLALLASLASYFYVDSSESKSSKRNRRASAFGQVGSAIGRWEMAPLALLVITLGSFNEPYGDEWTVAAVVVSTVLLLSRLQPGRLWSLLSSTPPATAALVVHALYPPNEVLLVSGDDSQVRNHEAGTIVRLGSGDRTAVGHLVDLRPLDAGIAWRALVPRLCDALPSATEGTVTLRDIAVELVEPDVFGAHVGLAAEFCLPNVSVVGTSTEGTSIQSARFEIQHDRHVSIGDVVWTHRSGQRTFWQIVSASVAHTRWAGDSSRAVIAEASQIGVWVDAKCGFEPDTRSPEPAQIAFAGEIEAPLLAPPAAELLRVGTLPGSPFPVMVDMPSLSRHHAAILGTTGTGKSHLSFALIDGLRQVGCKVIIVDQTGQYTARFTDAPVLSSVTNFLDGDGDICIYDLGAREPIGTVNQLVRGVYGWSVSQGAVHAADPARCVLVLEEAHNYVPESFVIDSFPLKAKAQDTSMVLMESRKYGLGFVLVSQRTAMVTKTALSQCNTVFAFQAIDRTGIDYLDGLCGPTLSRGIPTLPHRVALVMGRSVVSTAPMITYMDEAPVVIA